MIFQIILLPENFQFLILKVVQLFWRKNKKLLKNPSTKMNLSQVLALIKVQAKCFGIMWNKAISKGGAWRRTVSNRSGRLSTGPPLDSAIFQLNPFFLFAQKI